MKDINSLLIIVAVIIIVGLVLRYGLSSIGLVNAISTGANREISLLTLQNSGYGNYAYHGPTG